MPLYTRACGWDKDNIKISGKELKFEEKIDFRDLKIGFQKGFCVTIPTEPPYALALSIVRHPIDFSRGQIRVKRTDASEKRGTPVRRIGEQNVIERHSLPPTPNEGGIYPLTEDIRLPQYGTHFLSLRLKIYTPVLATTATEVQDVEEGWTMDDGYPTSPGASADS